MVKLEPLFNLPVLSHRQKIIIKLSYPKCSIAHLSSPAAVAVPSPANVGYRPGDMALLGLIMAALLVLCFIVIGFLISRLAKGNGNVDKICEVSPFFFIIYFLL